MQTYVLKVNISFKGLARVLRVFYRQGVRLLVFVRLYVFMPCLRALFIRGTGTGVTPIQQRWGAGVVYSLKQFSKYKKCQVQLWHNSKILKGVKHNNLIWIKSVKQLAQAKVGTKKRQKVSSYTNFTKRYKGNGGQSGVVQVEFIRNGKRVINKYKEISRINGL